MRSVFARYVDRVVRFVCERHTDDNDDDKGDGNGDGGDGDGCSDDGCGRG